MNATTTRAWRCCGVNGCGELIVKSYAAAQRHANSHGGARLQCEFV